MLRLLRALIPFFPLVVLVARHRAARHILRHVPHRQLLTPPILREREAIGLPSLRAHLVIHCIMFCLYEYI